MSFCQQHPKPQTVPTAKLNERNHGGHLLTQLIHPQVFATVVSSLAAVTALAYMIPFTLRIPFLFVWDTILFILWISLFGLFGSMYIKENAEGNGGIKRMKNAVVCFIFPFPFFVWNERRGFEDFGE